MQTHSRDNSILSKGWVYLIALAVITIAFGCIFVYLTVYDGHNKMLLSYVALIYAVFILYLMIVTSTYYLKVLEPAEIKIEVQNLRFRISDAFHRPRY
jgi:uncharacterized membrane protein